MAFCTKCGSTIEDEAKGCPVCNTKPENNNQNDNPTNPDFKSNLNKLKDKAFKNKRNVVCAVAIILAIILIVALASGKGYEKAIDNYISVTFDGKVQKVKNLAPSAYWDYLEETYDVDIDELVETLEDSQEDILDALEEEYGKRIKVSYKVTDADKLDKDDLKEIKDTLKDRYDIAKKSVTKAYELEIEMKIKGSEDEDEDELEMYAVKIDGKWYLMSGYGSFMVPDM